VIDKKIVARHETAHMIVALALGYPATGWLCENIETEIIGGIPGIAVGKMEWDEHDAATDAEQIMVAFAPLVYDFSFTNDSEENISERSGWDEQDIHEILAKYRKQSQRKKLREKCILRVYCILRDNREKLEEIADELMSGQKISHTPNFICGSSTKNVNSVQDQAYCAA